MRICTASDIRIALERFGPEPCSVRQSCTETPPAGSTAGTASQSACDSPSAFSATSLDREHAAVHLPGAHLYYRNRLDGCCKSKGDAPLLDQVLVVEKSWDAQKAVCPAVRASH